MKGGEVFKQHVLKIQTSRFATKGYCAVPRFLKCMECYIMWGKGILGRILFRFVVRRLPLTFAEEIILGNPSVLFA